MENNILDEIEQELEVLKQQGTFRSLKEIKGANSAYININGKDVLNFCSNNYLGLTTHPDIISYAVKTLNEYGSGAGASRLISGNLSIHTKLENALAKFVKKEAALVFPSGYQANLGVITSLANHNDAIFCDKLCHASIIDGAVLSRAKLFRYKHCDYAHLANLLEKYGDSHKRKIIITESIFSMDGDIADLEELANIAKKFNCFLLIDEAHALGVFGMSGRGCSEVFDLEASDLILYIGTLGKALGSMGAFVGCSLKLKEYFINKARSFIFSTGILPVACGIALKSLEIIQENPNLRENLMKNLVFMREGLQSNGFDCMQSSSQIIPIFIGDNNKTMKFSKLLLEQGIYIQGIRPPTVPVNTSRLRISLMSSHTKDEISQTINTITNIGRELGVI